MDPVLAFLVLALFGLVLLGLHLVSLHKEASLKKRQLTHYESTYLKKQGFTQGFGNYELRSLDGGRKWYAVEKGDNDALIIRGTAEEVFPGLLGRLQGWDDFVQYIEKNGPITLSGERAETERKILEAAGFEVRDR